MIVKCEQCQTRFKIPDEKVTEKGVKVRCTKCQHTFRVKRDSTASATEQPPRAATQLVPALTRPSEDPFARFGAGVDDGVGELTKPGSYALGVEASRHAGEPLQPSFAAQRNVPARVFKESTRVGAVPKAPLGRQPLQDEPTATSAPQGFDFAAALEGAPSSSEPPPFDFGQPPPAPQAYEHPPQSHQPPARQPMRQQPPPPAYPPQSYAPPIAYPPQSYAPPAPAYPPQEFALQDYAPPNPSAAYQPPGYEQQGNPQSMAASGAGQDPFANMEFGATDPTTSPTAPTATEPQVPSVFGSDGGDFFAAGELPSPPQSVRPDSLGMSEGGEVETDTSQRAALFEMPAPEPARAPEVFSSQSSEAAPELAPLVRPSRVSPEVGRTGPAEQFKAVSPKRRLGGLIFNVAIASVLVALLTVIGTVYLSEGKVELASFSSERLKATFSSSTDWAALDISNGLYDTRSGRPVFFVRGEVKNRTNKATRAKVRAEILDGNSAIRHADVWIGTVPTPEDLYSITVPDDVERLMTKLEKAAAEIMPGEKRGFLVPFYEYPPNLKGFRVRVTVIESGQGETAAR